MLWEVALESADQSCCELAGVPAGVLAERNSFGDSRHSDAAADDLVAVRPVALDADVAHRTRAGRREPRVLLEKVAGLWAPQVVHAHVEKALVAIEDGLLDLWQVLRTSRPRLLRREVRSSGTLSSSHLGHKSRDASVFLLHLLQPRTLPLGLLVHVLEP